MFAAKFSCLTALALAPWAQALSLQTPVGWQSSSPANVSWSSVATDPPFTLQLANTDGFRDTFSIANNVNPTANFASFTLPVIPQGTYTLLAINVTNAGQIYDETPSFTIQGPPDILSHSSAALAPVSGLANEPAMLALLVTSKVGASGTAAGSSASLGVTRSSPASSAINTGAAPASTGRGSSTAGAQSGFNNGAASLSHLAPWAIAALGAIAGAVVVL